jgi:hypothetical protein
MKFARWLFFLAGIYGLVVLLPLYFVELFANEDPRGPMSRPEFYYGFVGVALAWQLAFLVISGDPVRYRALMIPSVLEKLTFGVGAVVLFLQQRIGADILAGGVIDLILGVLFFVAWRLCGSPKKTGGGS